MPSASANISAKFIAQIEMSSSWVPRYSDPAEATRPRIVSISGSPAATSEPKASTRITIVTGQLNSSELIIAVRLAVLKSDHIPLAPVSETCTPSPCRRCSCVLRSSAARTMVLASAAAPACTIAVWPSREIDTPGCGATTDFTRRSAFSTRCVEATARWKAGSRDRLVGRVHDDHQGAGGQALEVLVDRLARGDRLRARGLPARARQRRLDPRGEDAEHDGHERPGDRDRPEMGGGVAAEAADRSVRGGHRGPTSLG